MSILKQCQIIWEFCDKMPGGNFTNFTNFALNNRFVCILNKIHQFLSNYFSGSEKLEFSYSVNVNDKF